MLQTTTEHSIVPCIMSRQNGGLFMTIRHSCRTPWPFGMADGLISPGRSSAVRTYLVRIEKYGGLLKRSEVGGTYQVRSTHVLRTVLE